MSNRKHKRTSTAGLEATLLSDFNICIPSELNESVTLRRRCLSIWVQMLAKQICFTCLTGQGWNHLYSVRTCLSRFLMVKEKQQHQYNSTSRSMAYVSITADRGTKKQKSILNFPPRGAQENGTAFCIRCASEFKAAVIHVSKKEIHNGCLSGLKDAYILFILKAR